MHVEKYGWSRDKRISTLAILIFIASALISFLLISNSLWKDVYLQLLNSSNSVQDQNSWASPEISGNSLITTLLVGLCIIAIYGTLPYSEKQDRIIFSIFLTLLMIGLYALILSLLGILNFQFLSIMLLVSSIVLIIRSRNSLRQILRKPKLDFQIKKLWSGNFIVLVMIMILVGLSFYYSISLPVWEFDALIYHATIAKIMYEEGNIPIFEGPSVGIEISGNYPPLFSAVGAGLYTLLDEQNDYLLRLLPPVFTIALILTTYRISEKIRRNSGKFTILLLSSTPLLIYNSIITSPTALLAALIAISVYNIMILRENLLVTKTISIHAIIAGLCLGLGLLSSYQALFYAIVPIATLLILFYKSEKQLVFKSLLIILISTFILGSIWYSRNMIIHQNPFYPWLLGPDEYDLQIFDVTRFTIHTTGSITTFGQFNYDIVDIRDLFQYHAALFPAFSAASIISVMIIVYSSLRSSWLVVWLVVPLVFIFGFGTVFPRYLMPTLPALVIPLGVVTSQIMSNARSKPIVATVLLILAVVYALIGFPAALANPAVNFVNMPDKLFFIENAGNPEAILRNYYDGDVEAWKWISENTNQSSRVATFDPRIYYMGSYQNIMPLDGREAIPLYEMNNLDDIKDYLRQHDIEYIFDSATSKSVLSRNLPLMQYLGENDFPVRERFGFGTIYGIN